VPEDTLASSDWPSAAVATHLRDLLPAVSPDGSFQEQLPLATPSPTPDTIPIIFRPPQSLQGGFRQAPLPFPAAFKAVPSDPIHLEPVLAVPQPPVHLPSSEPFLSPIQVGQPDTAPSPFAFSGGGVQHILPQPPEPFASKNALPLPTARPSLVPVTSTSATPVDVSVEGHPRFSYNYGVSDPITGDQKTHTESRDGDIVRGQYAFVDAGRFSNVILSSLYSFHFLVFFTDGSIRTVTYTADSEHGFRAVVETTPPSAVRKPMGPGRTHPVSFCSFFI